MASTFDGPLGIAAGVHAAAALAAGGPLPWCGLATLGAFDGAAAGARSRPAARSRCRRAPACWDAGALTLGQLTSHIDARRRRAPSAARGARRPRRAPRGATAWPAPGTTVTRRVRQRVRPSSPRSRGTSRRARRRRGRRGRSSSGSRSHSDGITPVPSPRSAAARPAAVLRRRSSPASSATPRGMPAKQRLRLPLAPRRPRSRSPRSGRRAPRRTRARAARSAGVGDPRARPDQHEPAHAVAERERRVQRDPAAHRVAAQHVRLVGHRAEVRVARGERGRAALARRRRGRAGRARPPGTVPPARGRSPASCARSG